jgi:hypothetical protein
MGIGGVETVDEYHTSHKHLCIWLHSFANQASHLQHNAQVLREFLLQRIDPFMSRLSLHGRNRRLTLNHKTTSPLESINQSLKKNSAIVVHPNMSLLQSFRTQEDQANIRMRENHLQACEKDRGRSLTRRSHTCNFVSALCEDELIKQRYQCVHYACFVDGPSRVRIKRLPDSPIYCERCEELEDLCPSHCKSSPITTFHRIRTISFIQQSDGNFEMKCSCLYQPTYGVPCRHQIRLLNAVFPHHIIARHHTKFHASYKQPDMNDVTEEFDAIKRDYRLIIKPQEFHSCMHNAHVLMEQQQHTVLPDSFWHRLGHRQICENGVISDTAHSDTNSEDDTFLGGAFSQDISLSQEVHTSNQPFASMQLVHQNSNLHDSTMSKVKGVINTCQSCNDPELESFWNTGLNALIGRFNERVVQKFGNESTFTGECVSMSVPVDRRKKYKRIKSRSEPVRKTNDLSKGERTKVQLSLASLITMDEIQTCVE